MSLVLNDCVPLHLYTLFCTIGLEETNIALMLSVLLKENIIGKYALCI